MTKKVYFQIKNEYLRGQRIQSFDILHESFVIVSSNYDAIKECFFDNNNNFIHYFNKIKNIVVIVDIIMLNTNNISISNNNNEAVKYTEVAVKILKNLQISQQNLKDCHINETMELTQKIKESNAIVKLILTYSITYLMGIKNYLMNFTGIKYNTNLKKHFKIFRQQILNVNDIYSNYMNYNGTELNKKKLYNCLLVLKDLLKL